MEIKARNVNAAISDAMWYLHSVGTIESSRNGGVIVAPEPVMTTYTNPCERVLFSKIRDANPFFHFMEGLWMLGGRNEVDFVANYASRMRTYSDDGQVLYGAYGFRWRHWFGYDQLPLLVAELTKNSDTRRAVLSMWDAGTDLHKMAQGGKDVPCNTQAYFDCRGGSLNMTVCNRSNDAVWGAYGANAVHFSMLQEYMAAAVGVPVGVYRQFSNNLHIYTDLPRFNELFPHIGIRDLYTNGEVVPFPMVSTPISYWLEDLSKFLADPVGDAQFSDNFFNGVAAPIATAWAAHKEGRREDALALTAFCRARDWSIACTEWLERRYEK